MHLDSLIVHAGTEVDPATGAVTPPIYLSTTFAREVDGSYPQGYIYTRIDNPNRRALEQCLATLEGGAAAIAFASGSAAALSIFQALTPGDHVLAPKEAYHGTIQLLKTILQPWGLAVTFVDMTDLAAVERSLQPNTRLIWIETPSNPLLKITDIQAVAAIAHRGGAICVCDSTWAPPTIQHPLDWGADWVVHATTKYLSGHSDVLGGVAIAKTADPFYDRVRQLQAIGGGVPSPFDCWLLLRGIRTLSCRLQVQSASAGQIATALAQHPQVEAVYYPGLASHLGHRIANQQMRSGGGMLSLQVRGAVEQAMQVAAKVKLFTRATSLGGVESLIEHRASMEGPTSLTPPNLLRLSIGLEHPQDLLADLAAALG